MYSIQKETITEIVSTQALDPEAAVVSINGVSLIPAPFVSLSIEQYRAGDLIIGGALNVSLNGTVYDAEAGGFASISNKVLGLLENIGQEGDCVNIVIDCGGISLVNGYGTITALDIQEGPDPTWTQLVPYGVNLQLYVNNQELVVKPNGQASEYVTTNEIIKDLSETINISHDNDSHMVDGINGLIVGRSHVKYNFQISATGGAVGCKDKFSQKTGIEAAEDVVQRRIAALRDGDIKTGLAATNYIDSDLSYYHNGSKYTEIRNLNVDPISGSVSVTGDLILRPTNITHPYAFVEISVEHSSDVTKIGSDITINGNIEGLPTPKFNSATLIRENDFHPATKDKMTHAETAYQDIIGGLTGIALSVLDKTRDTTSCTEGSLLDICKYQLTGLECDTVRINNLTVTRNFGQGTISFSGILSDAKNCNIPGAAKTEIEVSRNYPTDAFAEFTIPFRGAPLTQNLGTTTKETIAVSAKITLGDTGCNDLTNNPIMDQIISCGLATAEGVANNEGASGWYLTSKSINRSNTGDVNISLEYTRPHPC